MLSTRSPRVSFRPIADIREDRSKGSMTLIDVIGMALVILMPLAVGIAPLFLPQRYLLPWGLVLLGLTLAGSVWLVLDALHQSRPLPLMLAIPFAVGWILAAGLMPLKLRRS